MENTVEKDRGYTQAGCRRMGVWKTIIVMQSLYRRFPQQRETSVTETLKTKNQEVKHGEKGRGEGLSTVSTHYHHNHTIFKYIIKKKYNNFGVWKKNGNFVIGSPCDTDYDAWRGEEAFFLRP